MEEIKEEIKKEEIQKEEEAKKEDDCKISFCTLDKKKKIILGVTLLAVLVVAFGAVSYYKKAQKATISTQEAKTKIENLVADSGGTVTVGEAVLDGDMYKVMINAGGKEQELYISRDGKKLIQNVITFEEIEKQKALSDKEKPVAAEIPKSDKPKVELFVMSYCPFGTQMEKGILPVVAAVGGNIDYSLRFVDYVMHGEKEIAENLRQYCISKNTPAKLSAYLTCFLKKGEGTADTCLASAGIAGAGVKSCVAQVDAKFSVTKNAADKKTWSNGQFPTFDVDKADNLKYGVQGSPTLVINGVVADTGRDSASILKTICEAFNSAPKECDVKLSSEAPAPGFGEGAAAAGSTDASCEN